MTVRCNAETHCVNGRCVPNDPRPTRSTDDLLASDREFFLITNSSLLFVF